MRNNIVAAFCGILFAVGFAYAQTMQPAVNTPLLGCIEGRALRIVNGNPACSTTVPPTISNCGIGATLSTNATDFVGRINTSASILTGCKITFSKLYSNPSLGCLAQTNSATSLVAGSPVIGSEGGKTTMTVNLTLALGSGTILYSCFPV